MGKKSGPCELGILLSCKDERSSVLYKEWVQLEMVVLSKVGQFQNVFALVCAS